MNSNLAIDPRTREQTILNAKKRFQTFKAKQQQQHHQPAPHQQQVTPPPEPQQPRSRPNSHHRRRSSVSTARASAELMGIPLPQERDDEHAADPIRKALQALEGRASPRNSFTSRPSRVEIPDLDDEPVAPQARPDARRPLGLNSALVNNRDSFGKLLAEASSKAELGTLVEEDEEDEPENVAPTSLLTPPSSRPRPLNLNFRQLSLAEQTSLPTPAQTPSPRASGLRSLTLAPQVSTSPASSANRRAATAPLPPRQSSISYKRSGATPISPPATQSSFAPIPMPLTPEPTPTSPVPPSNSDLSPSRQAFIYQSHAALLSRVSELENLLATRSPSLRQRYTPLPSPQFSPSASPNDEFLSLISDLKAERDELRRDVQGWRQRVSDLEKHQAVLHNRVETERREAWVIKEQLGVLEIEKAAMSAQEAKLRASVDALKGQVAGLTAELARVVEEKEALVWAASNKAKHLTGISVQSFDSASSLTDVDEVQTPLRASFGIHLAAAAHKLGAVEEEPVHEIHADDDDMDGAVADEMARYEDEEDDDSDTSFYSPSRRHSSISFGHAVQLSPEASPPPSPLIQHQRRSSLSRVWVFPAGSAPAPAPRPAAEADRFFLCLEDTSAHSDTDDDAEHTYTKPSRTFGFGHGFGAVQDDDEGMPPFVLPAAAEEEFVIPVPQDKLAQFSFPPATRVPPRALNRKFGSTALRA